MKFQIRPIREWFTVVCNDTKYNFISTIPVADNLLQVYGVDDELSCCFQCSVRRCHSDSDFRGIGFHTASLLQ